MVYNPQYWLHAEALVQLLRLGVHDLVLERLFGNFLLDRDLLLPWVVLAEV